MYGVLAYMIGVTGLVWIILAMGGFVTVGLSSFQTESAVTAGLLNFGLIVMFGLQHSVMARTGFKTFIQRFIPEAAERATYVLMSGFMMAILIYFWQPVSGQVWMVENPVAKAILWITYGLGWGYLFLSTFVTNHFDLMGLRQVYLYFINKPYTDLPFTRKYMYSYSRHPMMLGLLIGIWAIPEMSVSHFILSSLMTLYVVVGVFFEERDLIKQFGKTYRNYRKEIASLLPYVY